MPVPAAHDFSVPCFLPVQYWKQHDPVDIPGSSHEVYTSRLYQPLAPSPSRSWPFRIAGKDLDWTGLRKLARQQLSPDNAAYSLLISAYWRTFLQIPAADASASLRGVGSTLQPGSPTGRKQSRRPHRPGFDVFFLQHQPQILMTGIERLGERSVVTTIKSFRLKSIKRNIFLRSGDFRFLHHIPNGNTNSSCKCKKGNQQQ